MSIYSNVTEKDLINLRKLAGQQQNRRSPKIKKRVLKQICDNLYIVGFYKNHLKYRTHKKKYISNIST